MSAVNILHLHDKMAHSRHVLNVLAHRESWLKRTKREFCDGRATENVDREKKPIFVPDRYQVPLTMNWHLVLEVSENPRDVLAH